MSTLFWVLGVWLLASLPFGMVVGWLCSVNDVHSDELPLRGELPATEHPGFEAARIPA